MKKLISFLIVFVVVFSCFTVTAFADSTPYDSKHSDVVFAYQPVITFSEDYQTLYMDGEPFSRFNASIISADIYRTVLIEDERNPQLFNSAYVDLTDKQKESISEITIQTNEAINMFSVSLSYSDGSMLRIYFLKDTYREDYENVINGNADAYCIDFQYPDGNIVLAEKSSLFGESTTVQGGEIYDYYYVNATNKDLSIQKPAGAVFFLDGEPYYLDYAEAIFDGGHAFFYSDEVDDNQWYTVHKITDENLVASIYEAQEKFYNDDFGIFFDNEVGAVISKIFLVLVFGLIPFAILIFSLVKCIRGKGAYKKIFGFISILCAIEVVVFTILTVLLWPSINAKTNFGSDAITGESDTSETIVLMQSPFTDIDLD